MAKYAFENKPMLSNLADCGYESLLEAFPELDMFQLGIRPLGAYLLVQMRLPKSKTASGIVLPGDVKEFDLYQNVLGKVIAVGPVAFKDRNTLEVWKEGEWVRVGDFVYVPKYTHNSRNIPFGDETIELRFVKDTDLIAAIDNVTVQNLTAYV